MTSLVTHETVLEAADYLRAHTHCPPKVGLVLGSGLSSLAERVSEPDVFLYQEIPHFPQSTVAGHSGRLVLGQLGGKRVCVMQGRSHYYEGYSAFETVLPIRVMQLMGADVLFVTNSAGAIRPGLKTGDLMAITDHINLVAIAGHNPLRGPNDAYFGPRFPDMSRAYDPELLDFLRQEATKQGVPLQEGVYAMVAGPSFETPAEIRLLHMIGADVVGMSTASEVVVARHAGMRVLGISVISNSTHGSSKSTRAGTLHDHVLEVSSNLAPTLASLVEGVLRRIP